MAVLKGLSNAEVSTCGVMLFVLSALFFIRKDIGSRPDVESPIMTGLMTFTMSCRLSLMRQSDLGGYQKLA